jgi:hypothetical protein
MNQHIQDAFYILYRESNFIPDVIVDGPFWSYNKAVKALDVIKNDRVGLSQHKCLIRSAETLLTFTD